jgi:hypothetical protein
MIFGPLFFQTSFYTTYPKRQDFLEIKKTAEAAFCKLRPYLRAGY